MEAALHSDIIALGKRRPATGYIRSSDIFLTAYLRVTERDGVPTLEVGNITVDEEERRKGHTRAFFAALERIAGRMARTVRVENVFNEVLRDFLLRRGYSLEAGSDAGAPTLRLVRTTAQ